MSFLEAHRSEGFPHTRITKSFLCVRLRKGTCFGRRVLVSPSLTQNRALKFKLFVGKSDVLGEAWGEPEGEGEREGTNGKN